MISSARITFAKMGPWRNLNWRSCVTLSSEMTSVPMMSEGIRSGVNWIRLKSSDSISARLLIISVLASPGTPSSRQCPPAKMEMSNCSMTASCPTIFLASSAFSFW